MRPLICPTCSGRSHQQRQATPYKVYAETFMGRRELSHEDVDFEVARYVADCRSMERSRFYRFVVVSPEGHDVYISYV